MRLSNPLLLPGREATPPTPQRQRRRPHAPKRKTPLPFPHPTPTKPKNKTANQGIGKEVARQLAAQGLTVVATARDPARGREAVDELQADESVRRAGGRVVLFAPLDVADAGGKSIAALAAALRDGSLGTAPESPVAILVNNAGLAYKGDAWGSEEARRTIDVNFRGARAAAGQLLPLMLEGCSPGAAKPPLLPRVVNVTSSAGGLGMFDRAAASAPSPNAAKAAHELKRRFLAAGEEEEEARGDALLVDLAAEFEAAVADGSWREKGWPGSMYGVSKALENALGRQLARRGGGGGAACGGGNGGGGGGGNGGGDFAAINVHPGYISTSMSSYRGPLPPSRGADTVVWAALLPPGEARRASGAFYHDRQPRDY